MRRLCCLILVITGLGRSTQAQYIEIGPGSTAAGDYLRGVGIAAMGMGEYNFDTAVAESINADTAIRVDQYISSVLRYQRARYAAIRRAERERFEANFAKIRRRIDEHPESLDVMRGDALNAILDQLNNPEIAPSNFRFTPAKIEVSDVRRIRYNLGEKGVSFTMQQLKLRGRWPVAFQDSRYAPERRAYARALDRALAHMVAQDMPEQIIRDYEATILAFRVKLQAEPWPPGDKLRTDATLHLQEMEKSVDLLKLRQVHAALAELDSYSGTTINDLRLFMQRHNLRVAPALTEPERELYPRLYTSLAAVREAVTNRGKGQDQ